VVGKRGRGRELDSEMNRESLASPKSGDNSVTTFVQKRSGDNSVTTFVQNCSSLFSCYFQLHTQINSKYYSVTPIIYSFVAIIIKYLYTPPYLCLHCHPPLVIVKWSLLSIVKSRLQQH